MMTQKEKLLALMNQSLSSFASRETVADYLLANNVVVLPCRCCECEHCDIGQNDVERWRSCKLHFGKYIDVDPTGFCSYAKRKGGD